jgi:hypothetical protein
MQVRAIPEDRMKVMRRMGGPRFGQGSCAALVARYDAA